MIAIIGAGLSGLTAARHLQSSGIEDFVIFEMAPKIGGRVQTKAVDGFLIDEGFQVLKEKNT